MTGRPLRENSCVAGVHSARANRAKLRAEDRGEVKRAGVFIGVGRAKGLPPLDDAIEAAERLAA
ncbi:MAG: hypothetical protein IPJ61_21060 [Tessaracoccus sp.]|uniref:hypothetical protein n=1 Tax=Tessaracoccus sp. TaxID=1971211 RepID=UPI001EC8FDA5|nr:hypothetical protein [Tessaracoccus sp.]MBK7823480.1 hypothetical protein [Tessaracoccus sp.]